MEDNRWVKIFYLGRMTGRIRRNKEKKKKKKKIVIGDFPSARKIEEKGRNNSLVSIGWGTKDIRRDS